MMTGTPWMVITMPSMSSSTEASAITFDEKTGWIAKTRHPISPVSTEGSAEGWMSFIERSGCLRILQQTGQRRCRAFGRNHRRVLKFGISHKQTAKQLFMCQFICGASVALRGEQLYLMAVSCSRYSPRMSRGFHEDHDADRRFG
ncbi:hypothetical protein amb3692 [Paramagnetospirillum magneticum AMB-1]|uniref:Uncharacterized protein n=1 Tax=Paramagnetospirillum magneticum (strain ATCC 700264 / AMB-1) TaxID=342108 RepID=Q2W0X9_PARM1|nr:hypothetical protein amb3692 [Paramagnetospirillum magneticum AMB-1]